MEFKCVMFKSFKSFIRSLLFQVTYQCLKPLRFFTSNKTYLVAPTDPGSYGDSAMIVSTINTLKKNGENIVLLAGTETWKQELESYGLLVNYRFVNGLYSRIKLLTHLTYMYVIDRPKSVYLLGADVMDGFYSVERSLARMSILHLATSFCKDVRLLGFSFNDSPSDECTQYLKRIESSGVKLYARDLVSSQRLEKHHIHNTQVADIAFMLEKSTDFKFDFFHEYICVNLNAIQYQNFGPVFIDKVISYLNSILSQGFNIVFIPHDDRFYNGYSDFTLMEEVSSRLEYKSQIYLFKEKLNAQKIRYLVSHAQFCVVGRKHMGVGALGEGIPTMFFGYQGKQEGLLKFFDIQTSLALLEPSASTDEWLSSTQTFINSISDIKAKIQSSLPNVMTMSEKNFL